MPAMTSIALGVMAASALAGVAGQLMGPKGGGGGSAPQAPMAPTPPDEQAITSKAQQDEQKRNALRTSTLTNEGGGAGILSDPNATYKKKTLLGN